jgi:hypothetical protein
MSEHNRESIAGKELYVKSCIKLCNLRKQKLLKSALIVLLICARKEFYW